MGAVGGGIGYGGGLPPLERRLTGVCGGRFGAAGVVSPSSSPSPPALFTGIFGGGGGIPSLDISFKICSGSAMVPTRFMRSFTGGRGGSGAGGSHL